MIPVGGVYSFGRHKKTELNNSVFLCLAYAYAFNALMRAFKRLFVRAALFLGNRPLLTMLSISGVAVWNAA